MKVLLHNEASGVHRNLRDGLRELGHEATLLITGGHIPQGRDADIVTGSTRPGWIGRMARHSMPLISFRHFLDYDVVNFVMGMSLLPGRWIRYWDIPTLKSKGAMLSYYGVGCDEAALLRVREDAEDFPCCASCLKNDPLGAQCDRNTLQMRGRASRFGHYFDFSVSPCYVYSHAHAFFPNASRCSIPFPINLNRMLFVPARNRDKTIIAHGATRRGFKGTAVVLKAVELLSQTRRDFEFRLLENLSHADYVAAMSDCDIYIDQVFSGQGYGMAALESLACGKIVISGNGPKNWVELPFAEQAPIVPSSHEPSRIADALSTLLDGKSKFPDYADRGLEFVKNHHDHVKIAGRFAELWSSRVSGR